jgi:hypothetical protein
MAHPLYPPTDTTWSSPSTPQVPVNLRLSLLTPHPSESWNKKNKNSKGKMISLPKNLFNSKNNFEMHSWPITTWSLNSAKFKP